MQHVLSIAVCAAGLLLAGSAAADTPANAANYSVAMQQFAFVPAQLKVAHGATVTWTNHDVVPHSVTAVDGSFDSGPIAPGAAWHYRVDKAGTLAYHCIYHPSMTASLVVSAKSQPVASK